MCLWWLPKTAKKGTVSGTRTRFRHAKVNRLANQPNYPLSRIFSYLLMYFSGWLQRLVPWNSIFEFDDQQIREMVTNTRTWFRLAKANETTTNLHDRLKIAVWESMVCSFRWLVRLNPWRCALNGKTNRQHDTTRQIKAILTRKMQTTQQSNVIFVSIVFLMTYLHVFTAKGLTSPGCLSRRRRSVVAQQEEKGTSTEAESVIKSSHNAKK